MDNFETFKTFFEQVNFLFGDLLKIKMFCENKNISSKVSVESESHDKYDLEYTYVIKEGKILEQRRGQKLSKEYLDYLINKFNLHKHIEEKIAEGI
jgi:hypothetical protein